MYVGRDKVYCISRLDDDAVEIHKSTFPSTWDRCWEEQELETERTAFPFPLLHLQEYCITRHLLHLRTYWNLWSSRPDTASCTPPSKTQVRPPPTQQPPSILDEFRGHDATANPRTIQRRQTHCAWPWIDRLGYTPTNDSPDRSWFPMRQRTSLAGAHLSARIPTAHTSSLIFRKTPSTATHSKMSHGMAHPGPYPEVFRTAYIQANVGPRGGHQMRPAGTRARMARLGRIDMDGRRA